MACKASEELGPPAICSVAEPDTISNRPGGVDTTGRNRDPGPPPASMAGKEAVVVGCLVGSNLTPGLVFTVGAGCGVIAAGLAANLWWMSYRRSRHSVVGFTAGALTTALRELAHAGGGDVAELRRCVELAAGLQRLIDG